MGYKCRFAERVVSTAQRLANSVVVVAQKSSGVVVLSVGRCMQLQRKRSNRNSLLEEEHVSTRA